MFGFPLKSRPTRVGVVPVDVYESRLSPLQPDDTRTLIGALVATALVILALIYTILVVLGILGVPAIMMIGDTTDVGRTLSTASDTSPQYHLSVDDFGGADHAQEYCDFIGQLDQCMKPVFDAHQALALEMMKSGVPNLRKISNLTRDANNTYDTARANLKELTIPDSMPSEVGSTFAESISAANAYIDTAQKMNVCILRGCSGQPQGFGDANYDANNLKRHMMAYMTGINTGARILGYVDPKQAEQEKAAQEGQEQSGQEDQTNSQ